MALFDTRALFEAYSAQQSAVADGVRVVPLALRSRHAELLVDEDRAIAENLAFTAALFVPEQGAPFDKLCVLFHGLNEGTEAKLFPWAASLAQRGTPALIFPSTFHLSRRPASFLAARGDAFARRRDVEGNARVSPYNAMLSQRMAERPDRFLRGTLQSYRDVVDVARALRDGSNADLAQWFAQGAHLDFLGYSIGGYLAQLALLANDDALFDESRCVLFSTGAALAQVRPQTILILDVHAQDQLVATYDTEETRAGRHPLFDQLGATSGERRWLASMLYADETLRAALHGMKSRVAAILNRNDLVFPADAVRDGLGALSPVELDLGLHELPFNQTTPLGDAYSDREGRRLLVTVVKSYAVADDLRAGFKDFVDASDAHLRAR